MYTGPLKTAPFRPDPSHLQYAAERERYERLLAGEELSEEKKEEKKQEGQSEGLHRLLEMISPEDSALIALILFLLCDNSENDAVLLGILLYVLLSK